MFRDKKTRGDHMREEKRRGADKMKEALSGGGETRRKETNQEG